MPATVLRHHELPFRDVDEPIQGLLLPRAALPHQQQGQHEFVAVPQEPCVHADGFRHW